MEQRRFSGKGHWYHETQSNHAQPDVLPLVPEAANVDDRFLLDLALPDEIVAACTGWLAPARSLCHQLFPLSLPVNRLRTLSAYDRLSTALTVAQACGVQRLCNHYAALLAPLPGPDSSRESNRRLAQITQYARQLASSPDVIDDKARNQLDEARVVAVFQALLGHPVRWLPGHHIQPHTLPTSSDAWISLLPVVELRYASAHQLESLSRWQAEPTLEALTPVLCHEPTLLDLMGEILINSRETISLPPPALSAAAELLTRSPDRFSAAQFTPLTEEGLTAVQAINLLSQCALEGWLNRLKVASGKAE
ncbi:hypothetical protein ID866_158 [Astraeus odoratus]|nr:hypothetical protein ID866_158 [Astraeus odoratus]